MTISFSPPVVFGAPLPGRTRAGGLILTPKTDQAVENSPWMPKPKADRAVGIGRPRPSLRSNQAGGIERMPASSRIGNSGCYLPWHSRLEVDKQQQNKSPSYSNFGIWAPSSLFRSSSPSYLYPPGSYAAAGPFPPADGGRPRRARFAETTWRDPRRFAYLLVKAPQATVPPAPVRG